ncbi:MAG TPA: hypothetical protein ENN53_02440 [Candidatus Acetothermia bacterium]|nr:hypothetical protein [Candidatus Acetothermia bacterium]
MEADLLTRSSPEAPAAHGERPHRWIPPSATSPDGTWEAVGGSDGTVQIRDAATQELFHTFRGPAERVECVAISPDGTTLASGAWDGTVRLWNVRALVELAVFAGHTDWVAGLAISPDGTLLDPS